MFMSTISKKWSLIFLITLIPIFFFNISTARSQPAGVSAYQIMSNRWTQEQCQYLNLALTYFEKPAIAVLWGSFGKNYSCLNSVVNLFGPDLTVIIAFSNEVGRRNRKLTKLDLLPKLSMIEYNKALHRRDRRAVRAIKNRIKEILDYTLQHPEVNWMISIGLESNFDKRAATNLKRILKDEMPFPLVYSPVGNDLPHIDVHTGNLSGTAYELHGYNHRASRRQRNNCVQNGDGTSIANSTTGIGREGYPVHKVRKWYNRCRADSCICLLWDGEWQGFLSRTWRFPNRRNFKFSYQDVNLIQEIIL